MGVGIIDAKNLPATSEVPTLPIVDHPDQSMNSVLNCTDRYLDINGRLIMQGGAANVHCAWDVEENRMVAVKLMKTVHSVRQDTNDSIQEENPDWREFVPDTFPEMMIREIPYLMRLNHPNIIKIFDFGIDWRNGMPIPFLVLEYLNGNAVSYENFVTEKSDPRYMIRFFRDIAMGLDYVHGEGVTHANIAPCNMVLNWEVDGDECRERNIEKFERFSFKGILIDFGTARRSTSFIGTEIFGTAGFTPASVLSGSVWEPKDDRWAFVASLWAVMVGMPPYGIESESEVNKVMKPALLVKLSTMDNMRRKYGDRACNRLDVFFHKYLNDRNEMGLDSCTKVVDEIERIIQSRNV